MLKLRPNIGKKQLHYSLSNQYHARRKSTEVLITAFSQKQ